MCIHVYMYRHSSALKNQKIAGFGTVRMNPVSQWGSFFKAFHQIRCCENELFVSSSPNVKFMQETYGQAVASKR